MSDLLNIADAWINAAKERGINIEDEDGYLAVIRDLAARVRELEAERDALRRDAERLRTEAQRVLADTEPDCGEPDCDDCKYWRPLRAAIDQARK